MRTRGFTLIELLVVLTLLSLAGVAMARLLPSTAAVRLRAAVATVDRTLRLGSSLARSRGSAYLLTYDFAGNRIHLQRAGTIATEPWNPGIAEPLGARLMDVFAHERHDDDGLRAIRILPDGAYAQHAIRTAVGDLEAVALFTAHAHTQSRVAVRGDGPRDIQEVRDELARPE